jgi:hypothetical protein
MKKYLRTICTICKRTTDKPVDNARFTPDGCTITLNCQGRLIPIEYRSNADVATAPRTGLTDWYPRNRQLTTSTALSAAELIDTATGSAKQLVLAVELTSTPASSATAELKLVVQADTPKAYNQYTFRFDNTFTTVSGVETTLEKKTLRFTAYGTDPDMVEVYVNGVFIVQGTGTDQYQIFNGTNSVPANLISFNSAVQLSGTTQVDVIVSKAASTQVRSITFNFNTEARRLLRSKTITGAWENVDSYTRLYLGAQRTYYLFTADISGTTAIDINTLMTPTGVSVSGADAPLSSAFLMLARSPYTQVDRYPDTVVRLDSITAPDYLKFYVSKNVNTLAVTQTASVSLYPPARLHKLSTENTLKTIVQGTTEQVVVDGAVVVGPDT